MFIILLAWHCPPIPLKWYIKSHKLEYRNIFRNRGAVQTTAWPNAVLLATQILVFCTCAESQQNGVCGKSSSKAYCCVSGVLESESYSVSNSKGSCVREATVGYGRRERLSLWNTSFKSHFQSWKRHTQHVKQIFKGEQLLDPQPHESVSVE